MKYKALSQVKVYEAFTAVVSNRIEVVENNSERLIAEVFSSSKDKFYTVNFDKQTKRISSDDNSAYFQHTLSYPMLASFMKTEIISFDQDIANLFENIEWKKINTKFKNNYQLAVDSVIENLKLDPELIIKIKIEVEKVAGEFNKLLLNV